MNNNLFGKRTTMTFADFINCMTTSANIKGDLDHGYFYGDSAPLVKIEKVIFHNPATIVFWADGTKTVVKVQPNELFDPEKGLAMAISKKVLGNKRTYYETFIKWLSKYTKQQKKELAAIADKTAVIWSEISKAAEGRKIMADGSVVGTTEEAK